MSSKAMFNVKKSRSMCKRQKVSKGDGGSPIFSRYVCGSNVVQNIMSASIYDIHNISSPRKIFISD